VIEAVGGIESPTECSVSGGLGGDQPDGYTERGRFIFEAGG